MPRSFLVKKHLCNKKPNYGALESKLKEVLPNQKTHYASYPPPSLELPTKPGLFFDSSSSLLSPLALLTPHPPLPEHCPRTAEEPHRLRVPCRTTEPHRLREPCQTTEHFSRTSTGCCKTTEPCLGTLMKRCETKDNYPKTPADRPSVPDQCLDCPIAYSPFTSLALCHPLNSDWPSQVSGQPLHSDWPCQRYFSCKWCDKGYVSLGALKMHIRTHTLPCVCKLCGKAFSRPWLLQGHIRTHTGEKPFSCPHCCRAFADRSNLRAHLQTHSELKKYQCSRCSKTFSRVSLLAKHHETGCCSL